MSATDPQGTIPRLYADILPPTAEFHDNGDGTGLLLLQPTVHLLGDYVARVIASDGKYSDTATLVVCFVPLNVHPPHWKVVPESLTVLAGTTGYIHVLAEDADGTIPGLTAHDLPIGASFSDHKDGTGLIVFSPPPGESGRQVILIIASDGTHADTATVTLVVGSPAGQGDAEWVYAPDTVTVSVGTERSTTVLANGRVGLPIILRAENLPANATFTDWGTGAGSLTFAPVYAQIGSFTVLLIATEGEGSDSASVVLLVQAGQNLPPVWGPLPESTVVRTDEVLELDITVSDPDGPPPRITVLWLPPNAEFQNNLDGTGRLVFAPYASQVGSQIVGFLAFDGVSTSEAQLRIIVVPAVNRPPRWATIPKEVSAFAEETTTIELAAWDPDRNRLSIKVLSAPYNTTLFDRGDGTGEFRITPSPAQVGQHDVRLIVSDTSLADTAMVVVLVRLRENRSPQWVSFPARVYVLPGSSRSFSVSATDPDSTIPSLRVAEADEFASIVDHSDGTATLIISPSESDIGVHTLEIEVTDGELSTFESVSVVVPDLGDGTPDSLSDSLGASFSTRLAAVLECDGQADLLQVHDLNGDGLEEIIFRQTNGNGDQALSIWEPKTNHLWPLPEPPGTFLGFTFRTGTEYAEPLLWTSDGRILELSPLRDQWTQVGSSPAGSTRFAWVPRGASEGRLLFLKTRSSSSSITHFGCTFTYYNKWSEGRLILNAADTLVWPTLGRVAYDATSHADIAQIIDGPTVRGLLCPSQSDWDMYQSGNCNPSTAHHWTYYLRAVLEDDNEPRTAATFYDLSLNDAPPYAYPDVRRFGLGLGRLRDNTGEDDLAYAFVNPYYSLRTVRFHDSTITESLAPIHFDATFWYGGIVRTGSDSPEFMLVADAGRMAHVFSIPDAFYQGLLVMPEDGPFATGATLEPLRRDLIYAGRKVQVFQVAPVEQMAAPSVIRVPGEFPKIQHAIDAAGSGDTVLVSPGEYLENLTFRGKQIVVLSDSGPAVTFIRPLRPEAGISLVLGEPEGTTLKGFTVYGSHSSPVVLIQNYARPSIEYCEFRDYSGLLRVIECDGGSVTITGNRFNNNSGGSCIANYRGIGTITRNIFDYNSCQVAIGIFNEHAIITNNTLVENRGGITDDKGYSTIRNNIVVGGSAYGINRRWYSVPPSADFIDYNLIWDNAPDYQNGALAGEHDLSESPEFVAVSSGDYRLSGNSPCINAGDPDPAYNDPDGTRNDMGAIPYESASPDPASRSESVIDLVEVIDEVTLNADNTGAADDQSALVRKLIDRLFFDSKEK
ncbi:MAG: right-handed parallel beta-helix repeat-containing protein [Candidatus Zixiibacteriota bacterium]